MNMRVLVVDDEPDVLELCRLNLTFEGHEVLEAQDAPQGLDLARSHRPDVIVLDVMLPNGDGIEVLELLKRDERTRHIPVILLTARARLEDRIRGWEAGAALYMTKPFSPDDLCEATARVAHMGAEQIEEQRLRMMGRLSGGPSEERFAERPGQTEPRP